MRFGHMRYVAVFALLAACGAGDEGSDTPPTRDLRAEAEALAQSLLIVDTHIDVPYRLDNQWDDVGFATDDGNFDYPRAQKGGLNAPFMSIYTPAAFGEGDDAFNHAEAMINLVERVASDHPDKFRIAVTTSEVDIAFSDGVIALPMGMENGAAIGMDLAKLNHFYERGIRYITLSHSRANQIADSSYDISRPNDGLSDFGHAVVRRMNQLGIMVDISHVSDKAFYDVLAVTSAPLIASHSGARAFTPGFERNMSDDMIRALAGNGGVIMINYGSAFLTPQANQYNTARAKAYEAHLTAENVEDTPETREAFRVRYGTENPYPFAVRNDALDHIDHVVRLVGIEHVGIGSDYDGVGDSLPEGLKDVSSYPTLIEGLLERGYSRSDIKKILGGNIMRVWRQVELIAEGG